MDGYMDGEGKEGKNALDSTGSDARSEPLPHICTELLPRERHAVHAERRVRGRRVEEPRQDADVRGVLGRRDGVRRAAPVYARDIQYLLRRRKIKRRSVPRPSCTPTSAFANRLCPVRSIHPHPVSAFHVFSAAHGHTFLPAVGLRLSPPASGKLYASSSCRAKGGEHGGKSARRASRMGLGRCDRYVSHTRDVKSA